MKKQNIFKSSRRKFLLAGLATTALNGVFITFNLEGNTLKKFNQFTEPFTKKDSAFSSTSYKSNLLKNFLAFTVEKLREDRFKGKSGDSVTLGFDLENVHTIKVSNGKS